MILGLKMNNEVTGYVIKQYSCQISAIAPLSANTYQINLMAPDDACLSYYAGQHLQLELSLENDGSKQSLSYTIANNCRAENSRLLQLVIHNSSEFSGKIINKLAAMSASNASADVTLPMGKAFLQTRLDLPHVLVAAGSGISKIKCIVEEIAERNPGAEVAIYWSNKNADDFYFLDFFQGIENACRNIKFVPVLESKSSGWSGRSGYIYEVVKEDFDSLEHTRMYLCGSPAMVYGTIDQLKVRGLKEQNCYSDVFEYAPRLKASEG